MRHAARLAVALLVAAAVLSPVAGRVAPRGQTLAPEPQRPPAAAWPTATAEIQPDPPPQAPTPDPPPEAPTLTETASARSSAP